MLFFVCICFTVCKCVELHIFYGTVRCWSGNLWNNLDIDIAVLTVVRAVGTYDAVGVKKST